MVINNIAYLECPPRAKTSDNRFKYLTNTLIRRCDFTVMAGLEAVLRELADGTADGRAPLFVELREGARRLDILNLKQYVH